MNQQALPASLWVYVGEGRIGTLYPTDPLSFEYAHEWILAPGAVALHPEIPLLPGRIATPALHAFFENLLPEGEQRKLIGMRYQVSSIFGLLAKVGGDTAGSVVLVPENQQPAKAVYQDLTWEQVNALVHADAASAREREAIEAAAAGMPAPRISISGAQFKMLLLVTPDGMPHRPMGTSPSTHILKPDMVRPDIKVFASAVNEAIVMRAGALCNLPTATVSYQPVTQACLVQRYDRVPAADGRLTRLWQADFCQMLGTPSDVKYEHDGGPSFKDCYDLLAMSAQPAVDRRTLLRWLFFNLYVGNNDSHAKNLALLATSEGLRLAPFYDLMNTRVYAGLGPDFAFSIGNESEPGKMTGAHLLLLAKSIGVAPRFLTRIATDMASQVTAAIAAAANEILPYVDSRQKTLAQRIIQHTGSNVKQMAKRLLAGPKPI
ncbi:type II toxin-antitoxin system HipA family toxin [Lacisediminimonas sp.]|uniref:type II toxin-antitoxin system HipA family toxin n=1 Tax=Lacisediminimonas sp. TaxID=3060582 RepID=UPI0027279990|nr:type II toxin-antitoxin system HipA family toxin [Lacisediminimonas sp.]MDO8300691.1 type II toxin-antitoxin system HipA family toxin [Lacisediminimonas sp.]